MNDKAQLVKTFTDEIESEVATSLSEIQSNSTLESKLEDKLAKYQIFFDIMTNTKSKSSRYQIFIAVKNEFELWQQAISLNF